MRSDSFLGGELAVTYSVPWRVGEDQPAEYSGSPIGDAADRLLFWLDILPVGADGVVAGAPVASAALVTWLRERENLEVGEPRAATIGHDTLPATMIDVTVPVSAQSEDPGCGEDICVTFLTWRGAGTHLYGIQSPNVVRLYLADVMYEGASHLFAIALESPDQNALDAFAPVAQPVIDSFTAPLT